MRKVCVVVSSRANYSSIKSVMSAIKADTRMELQVVAGASALLGRFGSVIEVMEADGFKPISKMHMIIEGETPVTMAQSTGVGMLELPVIFEQIKPDIILTVGDRFETLATAVSSAYMNIPLAHTMGGEVSGSIDESVRHAVTKFAHIHFPASQQAAERIIRMGEDPDSVHMVGCPRIDIAAQIVKDGGGFSDAELSMLKSRGVGGEIDFNNPFLLVAQHPVTTEYGRGEEQISQTLMAIHKLQIQAVMLWPNADAGSEDLSRGMRKFREHNANDKIRFYKNFPVETFVKLMRHCSCIVGNSSAAIREGAFLGVPAVNIGTRQEGRERATNVIDAGYNREFIIDAIGKQLSRGRYPCAENYGDGHAGERIADILADCTIKIQKRITY